MAGSRNKLIIKLPLACPAEITKGKQNNFTATAK